MNKKEFLISFCILCIGIFLRTFWLSKSPPSLNWDEAALGYNAYSLLKTGKDEYGYPFPLVLRSFDDYKPALYSYLSIPFILLFGLNEFSVRLLSSISGILSGFFLFLIAKNIFNTRVALLTLAFFYIEPWAIFFSRVAFEANLGLMLTLGGIYLLTKNNHQIKDLIFSLGLFALAAYSYHSYKILFPFFTTISIWKNREVITNKKKISFLVIFLTIITLPLVYLIINGEGIQRFESTSIFKLWNKEKVSLFSIIENPFYNLGKEILGRYFSYFSLANIFLRGTPEPNQQIPGFGLFYNLDIIFYILGIFSLAKNLFRPRILLILILLSPIPAILTWNWFVPVRTLLLYALLTPVLALGVDFLYSKIKASPPSIKILVFSTFVIFYTNAVANLATSLFFYLPFTQKGNWQYGFREIMQVVSPIQDNYEKIIFETGHAQPHIFVLFYSKYDPERYHQEIKCPDCVEKPRKNFNFGKYEFRKIYWPEDRNLRNTLFIGSEYSLPTQDITTTPNAKILVDVVDAREDFVARIVEIK